MSGKERGTIMKNLRTHKGIGSKRAAELAGISLRTLQRIEAGSDSGIENFSALLHVYDAKAGDLSRMFEIEMPKSDASPSAAYDRSAAHQLRLGMYSNMVYRFFYVSTKEGEHEICRLEIKTSESSSLGYLPCTAYHDGYDYECKLVSPPDNNFTFIYLTSSDGLKDRGVIILPHNRQVKSKLNTAIGKMLSLSLGLKTTPCYQKVFMISDSYELPDSTFLLQIKEQFLKITSSDPDTAVKDLYKISGADLHEQSSAVNAIVKERLKKTHRKTMK